MKHKEFYLNVEVAAKIDDHDLACAIGMVIDQVEPQSGWLDTYVNHSSQVLSFSVVPAIENIGRVGEVKRVVKDFLTDHGIKHVVEVNFQRDWEL